MHKPKIVTPEHLEYLDNMRIAYERNMFGAGECLEEKFGLSRQDASAVLVYWEDTFSERQSA